MLVLDTQTMSVIHTIDDIGIIGITRSQYGPFIITWEGGPTVRYVNTETYEETESIYDGRFFEKIQESKDDQDKWYVVSIEPSVESSNEYRAGIYDHKLKEWSYVVSLPLQNEDQTLGISDLEVLPNEKKVYVATFGGWYPEYHAYGWLY